MPDFASTCSACASPLAHDQRYCLGCGARVGSHRVEPPVGGAERIVPLPARQRRGGLPRPRTAAALILATLGAGTLAGAAAGPGQGATTAPLIAVAATPAPAPVATATPAPAAMASSLPDDDSSTPAPAPPAPEPAGPPASAPAVAGGPPVAAAAPASRPVTTPEQAATPTPAGPPAKHVVVVALSGHDASAFAADSPATYLAHDLPAQGVLLRDYRATTSGSLANELSLLAGAEPTPATQQDCPVPTDPSCRLPDDAASLPLELGDSARSWKAYVQGLPAPCSADAARGYSPPRNPFVYMGLQDCASSEAPTDALAGDFTDTDLAPALAYLVPDICHDGREGVDCPGLEPTGLQRADAWLREWVPQITGSKAFADDGLLVVLFDGGNLPPAADPPTVGAVVVSPSFAKPGTVSERHYDHLSLLRTLAGTFAVDPPGAAAGRAVRPLGRDVLRSQDVRKPDTTP